MIFRGIMLTFSLCTKQLIWITTANCWIILPCVSWMYRSKAGLMAVFYQGVINQKISWKLSVNCLYSHPSTASFTSFCLISFLLFCYNIGLIASPPLPLYPFLCSQGVIFARPTAECLTRWKEWGVKRQYCCQLWSLSPPLSLSVSLPCSDSRYISANVLLTSSTPVEYQQKLLSASLITRALKMN